MYRSQCNKPEELKEAMRKAHAELVSKDFMRKLSDFPKEEQARILSAEFLHCHSWRIVAKEDSISTPIRMVVDATMSGLNILLAKGENRLGEIGSIIIRSRSNPVAWSSDISKLYNQLHLDPFAYPFSLFLYNEGLDPLIDPDIWVMTRAWYGITPTGQQAGVALERLAGIIAEEYPNSLACIQRDRFVDDPGSWSSD